jgi:hypothetical protein
MINKHSFNIKNYKFFNLLFNKYTLIKIFSIFIIGVSSRYIVNSYFNTNVFVEFCNIVSIVYFSWFAMVTVFIHQIINNVKLSTFNIDLCQPTEGINDLNINNISNNRYMLYNNNENVKISFNKNREYLLFDNCTNPVGIKEKENLIDYREDTIERINTIKESLDYIIEKRPYKDLHEQNREISLHKASIRHNERKLIELEKCINYCDEQSLLIENLPKTFKDKMLIKDRDDQILKEYRNVLENHKYNLENIMKLIR